VVGNICYTITHSGVVRQDEAEIPREWSLPECITSSGIFNAPFILINSVEMAPPFNVVSHPRCSEKISNLWPLAHRLGDKCCVAIIYRLHPTKKNGLKAAGFFKTFSKFVDSFATNSGHLLILGDFNIHWDCQRNADTNQLSDILRSANLRQHVQEHTDMDIS